MKKVPLVSVVIPVKQHTHHLLFENLPHLAKQTYKHIEIIVLPNEQVQYDLTLLRTYKNLRIIPTGKITRPAQKRDIGVKEARGEIIAFIDDDAYPHSDWITNGVKLFQKNKKVHAVCGPGVLPESANLWEKVFDEVLKTWIGAGGYSYRFMPGRRQYVTDYPSMNFMIYKSTFEELGGFDNNYWPGEDSKLCNDLTTKYKNSILYDPKVRIYHHRRNNLQGYLKQHANYGFHRGAFFAHGDENSRKIGYLAPTVFILYLVAFILYLLVYGFNVSVAYPLVMYGLFVVHLLLKSFLNTGRIDIAILSVYVLLATHAVYGTMFIAGFRKGLQKNKSIYE